MVKIKLTAGIFGWQHNIIRAGDPAIEVDEATASRLVEEKGVAEYVTPPTNEPELPEGVIGIPEYSTRNTVKELQEIAELCGITFEEGMTKAQMVEALDKHIAENTVDDPDALTDEDGTKGEDAPTFDAAEAVQ